MKTQSHNNAAATGRVLSCLSILALLVAGGCGTTWTDDPPLWTESGKYTTTESHADFATFEFSRTIGWSSSDLEPGALMSAVITNVGGGRYWLDLTALDDTADTYWTWSQLDDAWDAGGWDDFDTYEPYSDTEYSLPSRELTSAEVQRMRIVFASVQVDHERIDDMIDYYYWTDFRWDNRSLSANPSYSDSETIAGASANAIVALLDDFRAASESGY